MRRFTHCPRCGGALVPSRSINDSESEYWLNCVRCNTYVNTYIPQPHQEAVSRDYHLYILNAGGYGTGKTTTDREEVYKHCFITPNANVLIGANVMSQYEGTILRDILNDLPKSFIKKYNTQKQYIELVNGARIMFRPLDDVDKLRSYNLSMFLVLEGSEVDPEAFIQLKSRVRNLAAAIPEKDDKGNIVYEEKDNGAKVPKIKHNWIKGIVESNPDAGWIRTEMLYHSNAIYKHGVVKDDPFVLEEERDVNISTHITSTDCNAYLPDGFIDQLVAHKPKWWTDRYVYGSFNYSEGLVHPMYNQCIVPYKEPDARRVKFMCGADYGLSDDFAYVYAYIDEERGKVVVYKETILQDKGVDKLAAAFHNDTKDIPVGGWFRQPVLDSKSGRKRDYNKKSLYDWFLDYGVNFGEAQMDINARVYRTNTYIENGVLEICENCTYLIDELRNYKFHEKKLGAEYNKNWDKPKDGNDHAITALHFMLMELPADPSKLLYGAYDSKGNSLDDFEKNFNKSIGVAWQLWDGPESQGNYEEQVRWDL